MEGRITKRLLLAIKTRRFTLRKEGHPIHWSRTLHLNAAADQPMSGQPLFAINRNVSNGFPDEGVESEVVVVTNEFVPLHPFFPFDGD